MSVRRAHVWITGRVQGVFFRHYTRQEAAQRGLSGWVRNLPDGRVEAVFQGEDADLEAMLRWCRQGPPAARVTDVELVWEAPDPGMTGFGVRH
jgi:acylphosphatase